MNGFILVFLALFIASITLFKAVHPIFGIIVFFWGIDLFYCLSIPWKVAKNLLKKIRRCIVLSGTVNDCFTKVMSVKLFHAIFGENKKYRKRCYTTYTK